MNETEHEPEQSDAPIHRKNVNPESKSSTSDERDYDSKLCSCCKYIYVEQANYANELGCEGYQVQYRQYAMKKEFQK